MSHFVLLPGDGIGPEVVAEARKVLEAVASRFGLSFTFEEHQIGGAAIDATGDPLPMSTVEACRGSDAVILGAIGGPKWDDPLAKTRPETGLPSSKSNIMAKKRMIHALIEKSKYLDDENFLKPVKKKKKRTKQRKNKSKKMRSISKSEYQRLITLTKQKSDSRSIQRGHSSDTPCKTV